MSGTGIRFRYAEIAKALSSGGIRCGRPFISDTPKKWERHLRPPPQLPAAQEKLAGGWMLAFGRHNSLHFSEDLSAILRGTVADHDV